MRIMPKIWEQSTPFNKLCPHGRSGETGAFAENRNNRARSKKLVPMRPGQGPRRPFGHGCILLKKQANVPEPAICSKIQRKDVGTFSCKKGRMFQKKRGGTHCVPPRCFLGGQVPLLITPAGLAGSSFEGVRPPVSRTGRGFPGFTKVVPDPHFSCTGAGWPPHRLPQRSQGLKCQ